MSTIQILAMIQNANIDPVKKPPKPKKTVPQTNTRPTQKLDIYVFGEGTAGELGLGGFKYDGNKKPIDVTRPRINHRLSAKDVGVVQLAVGGMHCAALTHDNKILTWGVNDQGALGRRTGAAKVKEITTKQSSDDSDSDEDEDEDDEYLNPTESEPREVNPKYFPEGTEFAFLAASDSATFAVTTAGSVYGWGTIRVRSILNFYSYISNNSRATTVLWVSDQRRRRVHSKTRNTKAKVPRIVLTERRRSCTNAHQSSFPN